MPIPTNQKSITDDLSKKSPLYLECQKPQLMYVKHQNYGVRKLWKRISDKNNKEIG